MDTLSSSLPLFEPSRQAAHTGVADANLIAACAGFAPSEVT
jgi:hypothetical protein